MYKLLMSNFLRISHTKKSLKSVNFLQSYLKNKKVDVFWDTVYLSLFIALYIAVCLFIMCCAIWSYE